MNGLLASQASRPGERHARPDTPKPSIEPRTLCRPAPACAAGRSGAGWPGAEGQQDGEGTFRATIRLHLVDARREHVDNLAEKVEAVRPRRFDASRGYLAGFGVAAHARP